MDAHRYDQTSRQEDGNTTNEEKFKTDENCEDEVELKPFHLHKMFQGSSSGSNAGIIYYKCLSEEMEKEIKKLQDGIDEVESEMITQNQNIKDLNYEKNKLLCDFHEQFRKFNQKIEYENKIEEEIEYLVKFLDQLMPLHNEINYVKSSENSIRNYVIEKYQNICSELQPVIDTFEKEVEELELKRNDFSEWKTEWETLVKLNLDINRVIDLHQEKLKHFKWSIKNEVVDNERIRSEGERIQMQIDAEILEKQQTLKNNATKIQQAFNSVKAAFSELSNIRNEIMQVKQKIAKYNEILFKDEQKITEIEQQILERKTEVKELMENHEMKRTHLQELEEKKKIEIEKEFEFSNKLHEYRQKIADKEVKMANLLAEERSKEQQREKILIEIHNQKEMIASFEMKNGLANEIARNENLRKGIADLTLESKSGENDIFEFNNELEIKTKTVNELKKKLLSRNISFDEESPDKNILHSYLIVENEENVLSKFIDKELDTLLEDICQQQPHAENLKQRLDELLAEGFILKQDLVNEEKLLQQSINSVKNCENSILSLKQNVYQGKYVTVQELNKQLTALSTYAKNERIAIEKLKQEIWELTELGKKRRLLSPGKRHEQDVDPVRTTRTARPRKKVEESKNLSQKNVSQNKDVYCFFK